jgi:hypothetical protein
MSRGIVTVAIVLAVCVPLSGCGSSARLKPKAVDAAIVAAALSQKSVHWTEVDSDGSARWTSDVAADSGTQRVIFDLAGMPTPDGKAQVVLVGDVAYVRGDPVGLEQMLYLTPTKARKYAAGWISIPKGSGPYSRLVEGLTLASIVHHRDPGAWGLLRVDRKETRGTGRLVVVGMDSVCHPYDSRCGGPTATLTARANGDRLPIAFTSSGCAGCVYRGSFSKWNEPVHVQAPRKSTPIVAVCGRCRVESISGPHG